MMDKILCRFAPAWLFFRPCIWMTGASFIVQLIKNLPAMQETPVQFAGSGRFTGKRIGYPLQYSGLENSMNCIVHGVAKSWTWLSDFHFYFHAEEQPSKNMSQTGQKTYLLCPCHGLASSTASSMMCIMQRNLFVWEFFIGIVWYSIHYIKILL